LTVQARPRAFILYWVYWEQIPYGRLSNPVTHSIQCIRDLILSSVL
jgi:hypothetical protein